MWGDVAGNWKLAKGSEGGRRSRAKDDVVAAAILAVAVGRRGSGVSAGGRSTRWQGNHEWSRAEVQAEISAISFTSYTTVYHRRYTTDKAILGHGGQGVSKEMVVYGGDRGNRTPNLGIANAALSLLSYIPTGPLRGL